METLLLTSRDLETLINEDDAIAAMKEAFKAHGENKTQMPSKVYLDLPLLHGDFRAMPAYIENLEICGLKWVNSHPENIVKKDFPAVMATLVLNDPQTGFPLAIMDATLITKLRTGAAGALASSFLARLDSRILALVGCGIQAEAQLSAHLKVFKLSEIRVWGHKRELAESFKKRMEKFFTPIQINDEIETCVQGSDIISTTTPSRKPLILREWIHEGVHINAIGADAKGKQELDPKILKEAYLVVDEMEQSVHGGEVNVPFSDGILRGEDIDATMGQIVSGKKPGRRNSSEITVFDSTGLAIQDLALGYRAYQKAIQQRQGKLIQLI